MAWDPNKKTLSQTLEAQGRSESGAPIASSNATGQARADVSPPAPISTTPAGQSGSSSSGAEKPSWMQNVQSGTTTARSDAAKSIQQPMTVGTSAANEAAKAEVKSGFEAAKNAQNTMLSYSGQKDASGNPVYAKPNDTQGYDKSGAPVATSPIGDPEHPIAGSTTQVSTGVTDSKGVPEKIEVPTIDSETVQKASDNIAYSVDAYDQKQKLLEDQLVGGELAVANAAEQIANEKAAATQKALQDQQDLLNKTLSDKNAAIAANAKAQEDAAAEAERFAQTQLEIQQKRAERSFQDQIANLRESQYKTVLTQESQIAAMGGFGNTATNNKIIAATASNDREINSLVYQSTLASQEITNQMLNAHKEYTNSISRIEADKASALNTNYNDYLRYVNEITNNRMLTENERAATIMTAKGEYKRNVAEIHMNAFNDRYNKSVEITERVRKVQNEERDDARATMKDILSTWALSDDVLTPAQEKQLAELEAKAGYPVGISLSSLKSLKAQAKANNLQIFQETNDRGDVTFYSVDKTTGKLVNNTTLAGIGKITEKKSQWKLSTDDWGDTILYNEITGETKRPGEPGTPEKLDHGAAMGGTYSNGESTMTPDKGKVPIGNAQIDEAKFDEVFNVGDYGGQCGTWASTMSTARKVGNTWNEKLKAIDKRDNPKPGDKLLLPFARKTDGTGWGHVALVTSYNAGTGDIGVAEANMDGKGTIRKHVYNLNDLKKKYKEDFGFASGQLKPAVLAKLEPYMKPLTKMITDKPIINGALNAIGKTSGIGALAGAIGSTFSNAIYGKEGQTQLGQGMENAIAAGKGEYRTGGRNGARGEFSPLTVSGFQNNIDGMPQAEPIKIDKLTGEEYVEPVAKWGDSNNPPKTLNKQDWKDWASANGVQADIAKEMMKEAAKKPSKKTSGGGVKTTFNPQGYTVEDAAGAAEYQTKAAGFAQGMIDAEKVLDSYDKADVKTPMTDLQKIASSSQGKDEFGAALGTFMDSIQDSDQRAIMHTRMLWVQNKLRRDSGAAISPSEYYQALTGYFPDANSSAKVISDLKEQRANQTRIVAASAGPAAAYINEGFTPTTYIQGQNKPGLASQTTNAINDTTNYWFGGGTQSTPKVTLDDVANVK